MIYIVSGPRRSGTSALMAAIYAGSKLGLMIAASMDAYGRPIDYEERQSDPDGYTPNPGGAYEVGTVAYLMADFLRSIPPDSLIKILFDGLPNLPKGEYKILFCERDPKEIEASTKRVEEYLGDNAFDSLELTKLLPFSCFRPYSQEEVDHVKGICSVRQDIDLITVNYDDVISNPLGVFNRLKSLGWPIDPQVSAEMIDPQLYRSRKMLRS